MKLGAVTVLHKRNRMRGWGLENVEKTFLAVTVSGTLMIVTLLLLYQCMPSVL